MGLLITQMYAVRKKFQTVHVGNKTWEDFCFR
jgi:hypothetical protein